MNPNKTNESASLIFLRLYIVHSFLNSAQPQLSPYFIFRFSEYKVRIDSDL